MKLAAFLQVHNEVEKGNLRRCLDSASKYCDVICVYDDASTDNSVNVALSYNKVKLIRGTKNEFNKEMHHKNELLNFTMMFKPDWIFWIDADEVIEKRGEDGALRELAENSDYDAHDFRQVNFWRSEKYYRTDGAYNRGIFCRLWRASLPLSYSPRDGLHQRQYPEGIKQIKTSDIRVLHYGFGSDNNIVNKYRTYRAYGQSGWDLQRLIDESGLTLAGTRHEWLGREPRGPSIEEIRAIGPVKEKV